MARPRRGDRFSSAAGAAVFAAWLTLSDASRWEVYRATRAHLAVPDGNQDTHQAKVSRAIATLNEATDLSDGNAPSESRFRTLREQHPERYWPDDRRIRAWLGVQTWNEALARAHLPTVADGDAVVIQLGPAFSREELRAAVSECASDLGYIPSWTEYLAWARRPDVKARPARRPTSQGPFERVYGANWWSKAQRDASLPADASAAAGGTGRIRSAGYYVNDEKIHKDLREVAKRIGRSPRSGEYTAARQAIYEETKAEGRPRALVAYATIQKRYGTWDAALVAAGLEPLGGRHTGQKTGPKGPTGRRIPDIVITRALREAYDQLGEPFTQPAYSAWREDEILGNPRRKRELPSYHTVWKRYGTWEAACAAAFDE
jgi:hypothetical protein